MKLKKIIDNLNGRVLVDGNVNFEILGIACDSKAVKPGYLFAALRGSKVNGADFIDEAIDRGALAVILDVSDNGIFKRGSAFIYVKDARFALAQVAQAYFGDLSAKMRMVAVTGTNGKTTITYLIESMFNSSGESSGVIGTVNYRFARRAIPSVNTTPSSLEIYSLLSSMLREKIKNCVMEISSHSLEQARVETLLFDAAIFTNLTREHLDFHKNMEDYLDAKLKLFEKIKKGGAAIVNIDDPMSGKIIEKVKSIRRARIITYGIDREANIMAKDIVLSSKGLKFRLVVGSRLPLTSKMSRVARTVCAELVEGYSSSGASDEKSGTRYSSSEAAEGSRVEKYIDIESSLIGRHNVYNILASVGGGLAIGMSLSDIKIGIEALKGLPGRLESVECGQKFSVYVDYAHTEDGLEKALKSLRELNPKRIISVFGCGGGRDKTKRPGMGKISTELSDIVVITSDNPRSEKPMDIINEILKGIGPEKNNYIVEENRFNAIKEAIGQAKEGDIILLAGKGHETYQVFKDTTVPFDDREVVRKILKEFILSADYHRCHCEESATASMADDESP